MKPATQTLPFVFAPPTPPQTATLESGWHEIRGDDNRQSLWSTSQMSERLAQPYVHNTANTANTKASEAVNQQSHERTLLFSAAENHERSDSEAREGLLRIVINRSAGKEPRPVKKYTQPTLEVPIPHYRIGTPRFSSQGTPILRGSAYSRISESAPNNFRASTSSIPKIVFPVRHSTYSRDTRARPLSDMPTHAGQTLAEAQARHTINSAAPSSGDKRAARAPAEAALFDDLIQMQDDPSVVRYAQRTGEIVAATPARIIAQISSASFMDYELVSDFFLTFRSYLSTHEVLDLLLARLRWAINRLEDDGRIIRIRTFAALRHWILNYFMDDFVVDRKLRKEFCDQINDMYRKVQQRNGGGTSDLKILQDLKRCWNGRCSLYWDSDEFVVDARQQADVVPGGVLGSRNSSLTSLHVPAEQFARTGQENRQEWRPATQSWFGVPPQNPSHNSHRRRDSAIVAEGPVSIGSEKSLQPISCSIPTKGLRRSPRLPNGTKEPHPVPSTSRRQLSPSEPAQASELPRHASTRTHKRSASFTDSFRDRNSGHSGNHDFIFVPPHAGSLIRGNVIPPGSPYIDVFVTGPKPQEQSALNLNRSGPMTSATEGLGIQMTPNSGVKTFIGSIRRALSTRQTVNGPGLTNMADPRTKSFPEGKKSTLPLNVARSNDALRGKVVAAPSRTHLRIDLLCAAISHSYQIVQDQMRNDELAAHQGAAETPDLQRPLPVLPPDAAQEGYELKRPRRLVSQATAESGSIFIVDDTGLDIPSMSGALPVPPLPQYDTFSSIGLNSATNAIPPQPTYLGLPSTPSASRRSSGVFARRRSNSLDTGIKRCGQGATDAGHRHSRPFSQTSAAGRNHVGHARKHQSTATATTAIRRSASYDDAMLRHDPGEGLGEMSTNSSHEKHDAEEETNLPAPTLRRRPGGDLRKVQTVHDLDSGSRHPSIQSASSDSDSVGGSLVIMANRPKEANAVEPPKPAKGSVSLIHTHSSQHLRPSFEAAVSGFSAIPDDDDGGLEATLLKLEGRYEKQSPNTNSTSSRPHEEAFTPHTRGPSHEVNGSKSDKVQEQGGHRPLLQPNEPHLASSVHILTTRELQHTKSGAGISNRRSSIYGLPTSSIDGSDDSFDSIPVLERRMTDEAATRHAIPRSKPAITVPRPLFDSSHGEGQTLSDSSHPSIEVVEETASMGDIPQGATMPMTERSPTAHSFLLDADENLSDLSSELSVDIINYSDVVARNPSPLLAAPGTAVSGLEIPTHPLAHPPSPSFTLHRLATPQNVNLMMFQKPPLTPDPSPTQYQKPFYKMINQTESAKEAEDAANSAARVSASSGHIPWILPFDSELLAEQMTLVEKAALSEVDWSDLVNMRWDNSATTMLNWVDFLSAGDHKGIDLVITRFNIMVKWALSEIVLTQNIYERAQTIMKYIHVAAHARRLRNYATMLQITIALTSSDCSRLKQTWELVHPPERSLLKNMEALIQPLRNFHDLRVEMETADLTEGCIPFVGMLIRLPHITPLY
jgi:hypothetical protein